MRMRAKNDTRHPLNPDAGGGRPLHSSTSGEDSIEPLLEEIRQKHGEALQAILVYGSWLRGKRDTMLDFYVLVEDYRTLDSAWQGWMCKLLPPNVYHIHHTSDQPQPDSHELRAKYALLTLDRFCEAMKSDFHSYFWARFAQPCKVLYARDERTQNQLKEAFSNAAANFINRVLPTMENSFNSERLWTHGLALTYQCELRTESSNRGESIYDFNPGYYDEITRSFAATSATLNATDNDNTYRRQSSGFAVKKSAFSWWARRVQGKVLSVMRLF